MQLPADFVKEMRGELGAEAQVLFASYGEEPVRGLRLNARRCQDYLRQKEEGGLSSSLLEELLGSEPVPWCACGRYRNRDLGASPYHAAGAFYIQEPSAMAPAALLAAKPGERVLDLCAAPGGKSTQISDALCDTGLLVANDLSASRGRAVVRNLERFGAGQILVTACAPEKLANRFPAFFDAVLADVPCSGEGMFRRDPAMRASWEQEGPEHYAPLQREILAQAALMVRPGGRLVYSTCTFARTEDEDNIRWFLEAFPDFTLAEEQKLLPHRVKGEGQYAALLFRADGGSSPLGPAQAGDGSSAFHPARARQKRKGVKTGKKAGAGPADRACREALAAFLGSYCPESPFAEACTDGARLHRVGEEICLLPALCPSPDTLEGLRFLRTGLHLGTFRRERFSPSQALAMALDGRECTCTVDFSEEDERVIRYLKGETVEAGGAQRTGGDGWCLVCLTGLPLGWAKRTGDTLKNAYDPGWRLQ